MERYSRENISHILGDIYIEVYYSIVHTALPVPDKLLTVP